MTHITVDVLEALYKATNDHVTTAISHISWGADTHGRYGMTKIHLPFLKTILAEFQAAAQKIQQLLQQQHQQPQQQQQ